MNVSPTGSTDSVVGGGFGLGPSGNSNGFMNFGNAATDNNSSGAVRKDSAPLDISQSEGYELLSPQEQTLCTSLRLLPRAYLVIKETLISEYQKSGGTLKKRMARSLIKIDVNKTSRVWDFFITVSSK